MLFERPATRTARSFLRCFASSSKAYATGTGKMALLPSQGVYKVTGPDSPKFLKGLTCKDVERIGGGYTGFLNATGRVLHTNFILPVPGASPPSYLITHSQPHPNPLSTLLPQFKLRSKVKLEDVSSSYAVWQAWGSSPKSSTGVERSWKFGSGGAAEAVWDAPAVKALDVGLGEGEIGCWDLRTGLGEHGLGRRILVPTGQQPSLIADGSHEQVGAEAFDQHRWTLGVPEGTGEVIPGSALPLESCMDIHGGADFRKGCYVGQELTVRTYMRGATHKRILPVHLFPLSDLSLPLPPISTTAIPTSPEDISFHPEPDSATKRVKSAGKLLCPGLALLRVEMARKACWSGNWSTVGDWVQGSARLTVSTEGVEYGVWVNKGEAYAAALEAAVQEEERRVAEEAAAVAAAAADEAEDYEQEEMDGVRR